MLEWCSAADKMISSPGLIIPDLGNRVRRQVDAHGTAGGEQEFRRFRSVDESGGCFPRLFVRFRGQLAQVMGAAVDVGVLRFIIAPEVSRTASGF